MKLKEIPLEKKHQDYLLKQILRKNNAAIYSLDDGYEYEVVKICIEKVSEKFPGHKNLRDLGFTHREVYPSSEKWGKYGWSFKNKDDAMKKFNDL